MDINEIKKYINIIEKEDVDKFLKNNDIILSNEEFDYIYDIFKNKSDEILLNDGIYKLKNNINEDAYNKLFNLYNKYKRYIKKI